MNQLFAEITPFHTQLLDVGEGHQLYVEQCGNPQGQPVIFIHGGPGAGCSETDRRFFEPDQYHIILFDQRGCGRSLPFGSLESNTTEHLVADIERIRQHFAIDKWHVFGGSWGSTLSLVYAQTHPNVVKSLVLRGIFLAREQDNQWTFDGGGGTRIFADYWQEYLDALPANVEKGNISYAYQLMIGDDKELALRVAKAWAKWETSCCTLEPNEQYLAQATTDDRCWTISRHEAHFLHHGCFLEDNQIINNAQNIAHIPTTIVHGRYDIVCPFDNAWLLHKALPHSKLVISRTAGHSSTERETTHHLVNATNAMLAI
jgi:proline iminopeptidase